MDTDPSKSQYIVFSLIVSMLASFALNFFLPGIIEVLSGFGYPLSVGDAEGFGRFFIKLFNAITMGGILAVPVFYGIKWLQDRSTGGGAY